MCHGTEYYDYYDYYDYQLSKAQQTFGDQVQLVLLS